MIKRAWEQFLRDGDEGALKLIADQSVSLALPDEEYPALHRITDIVLKGVGYRVLRHADSESGTESLFIVPQSIPIISDPGVPYWLSGARLFKWIADEIKEPAKGPRNWDAYR